MRTVLAHIHFDTQKLIQTSSWTFRKLHENEIKHNYPSFFFLSPVGNTSVHIICDVFLTVAIVSDHVTQHVLLHKSVGASTKHSVREGAYCPQCFLQYFYPADFNVIISSMISAQSKTHPPTNNTPLSVNGTKTQTHRVQSTDT